MPAKTRKLTPKQKSAADAYLAGATKTDAYRAAGYGAKNAVYAAWQLFEGQAVKEYVAKRQQTLAKQFDLKQEDIIAGLYDEATYRGEGASHGARVTAWVQLGKTLGMFQEKKDSNLNVEVIGRIIFQGINDQDYRLDEPVQTTVTVPSLPPT